MSFPSSSVSATASPSPSSYPSVPSTLPPLPPISHFTGRLTINPHSIRDLVLPESNPPSHITLVAELFESAPTSFPDSDSSPSPSHLVHTKPVPLPPTSRSVQFPDDALTLEVRRVRSSALLRFVAYSDSTPPERLGYFAIEFGRIIKSLGRHWVKLLDAKEGLDYRGALEISLQWKGNPEGRVINDDQFRLRSIEENRALGIDFEQEQKVNRNTNQNPSTGLSLSPSAPGQSSIPPPVVYHQRSIDRLHGEVHEIVKTRDGIELDHVDNPNFIGVHVYSPYAPNQMDNSFQTRRTQLEQDEIEQRRIRELDRQEAQTEAETERSGGSSDSFEPGKDYEFYFAQHEYRQEKKEAAGRQALQHQASLVPRATPKKTDKEKQVDQVREDSGNALTNGLNKLASFIPGMGPKAKLHADKRRFDYGIQMPAFLKGSDTYEERYANIIIGELTRAFGDFNLHIRPSGIYDKKFCYIEITADLPLLERLAEREQVQCIDKDGHDFIVFDGVTKMKTTRFGHPHQQSCPYRKQDPLADSLGLQPGMTGPGPLFDPIDGFRPAASFDEKQQSSPSKQAPERVRECHCEIFLPYQRLELIRILIEQCLDEALKKIDERPYMNSVAEITKISSADQHTRDRGLRELKRRKIIKQIFPLHKEPNPDFYESRKTFKRRYCNLWGSFHTAMSLSERSNEMLDYLRDYFGEKIALYFGFLHFYNSFLLYLAIFGIGPAIWQYYNNGDNPLVIPYCVIVIIWSSLFMKFWNRRNNDLTYGWNMRNYSVAEKELDRFIFEAQNRPESKDAVFGFYEPEGRWIEMEDWATNAVHRYGDPNILKFIPKSHRDVTGVLPYGCFSWYGGNDQEGHIDRLQLNSMATRIVKMLIGSGTILTLAGCVSIVMISLLILRLLLESNFQFGGSLLAGIINGVVIFLLDFVYRWFALKLTIWENHRTLSQFEARLATKSFAFQFVNAYFTLFYIAFFKPSINDGQSIDLLGQRDYCRDGNGNPAESCMGELSNALLSILVTRFIISTAQQRWLPRLLTRTKIGNKMFEVELENKKRKLMEEQSGKSAAPVDLEDGKKNFLKSLDNELKAGLDRIPIVDPVKIWKEMDRLDVEYQADQPPFQINDDVLGTFEDFNQCAISFGYVVMFAPAFPIAPLLMLVYNIIESSTDSTKLFLNYQRPRYAGAADVGRFWWIFLFLTVMAIGTNVCIIVFTSRQLQSFLGIDPTTTSRLITAGILEHIMAILVLVIFITISDERPSLRERLRFNEKVSEIESEYAEWLSVRNRPHEGEDDGMGQSAMNDSANLPPGLAMLQVRAKGKDQPAPSPSNNSARLLDSRTGFDRTDSLQRPAPLSLAAAESQLAQSLAPISARSINPSVSETGLELAPQRINATTKRIAPVQVPPVHSSLAANAPQPELCFPFTIHNFSALKTSILSECCVAGQNVYRLAIGRKIIRNTQDPERPMLEPSPFTPEYATDHVAPSSIVIEFFVRYVSGPVPHQLNAYLLCKKAREDSIGFVRSLSFLYEKYTSFGYSAFANLDQLRECGVYNDRDDSITFGLLIPNTSWMRDAIKSHPIPLQPSEAQPSSSHMIPDQRLPGLTSGDELDRAGNRLNREVFVDPSMPAFEQPKRHVENEFLLSIQRLQRTHPEELEKFYSILSPEERVELDTAFQRLNQADERDWLQKRHKKLRFGGVREYESGSHSGSEDDDYSKSRLSHRRRSVHRSAEPSEREHDRERRNSRSRSRSLSRSRSKKRLIDEEVAIRADQLRLKDRIKNLERELKQRGVDSRPHRQHAPSHSDSFSRSAPRGRSAAPERSERPMEQPRSRSRGRTQPNRPAYNEFYGYSRPEPTAAPSYVPEAPVSGAVWDPAAPRNFSGSAYSGPASSALPSSSKSSDSFTIA